MRSILSAKDLARISEYYTRLCKAKLPLKHHRYEHRSIGKHSSPGISGSDCVQSCPAKSHLRLQLRRGVLQLRALRFAVIRHGTTPDLSPHRLHNGVRQLSSHIIDANARVAYHSSSRAKTAFQL